MTAPRRIAPLAALVGALAITFVTTVGSPSAAMSGSLSLSDAVVAPGTKVTLSGSLPPQRARTVKLQRRASGSWVTVTSRKSSSTGRFSFTQTSPTSGARTYRVLAPATTLAGKRYAAVATPSRTVTVVRMVDVDAGQNHACAVGSNHRAWCWGENRWGQLGDGTGAGPDPGDPDVSGPVRVVGSGWSSVSATGGSTCGLKTDHTGWCWGDHSAWVSDSPKAPAPVQVAGAWKQLATGWFHVCGVDTDGSGWCWGRDDGQLGTADPVPQGTRNELPGTWTMVVPGSGDPSATTCGVQTDHSAWCWGADGAGQAGNGAGAPSAVPVQVSGAHEWRSVTVGYEHACGIDTTGTGWCWGSNLDGRLGDGTFVERDEPVQVTVAASWKRLDAGFQHTCGITTTGAGWCWGLDSRGQLGDGQASSTYYPAPEAWRVDGTWTDLAAGWSFTAGARAGVAWAWGQSDLGQAGHGQESADRPDPRKVSINP